MKRQSSRQLTTRHHAGPTPLPDLSRLEVQLPISLVRSVRLQAALDAMTVDEFVREAIEERLYG